MLEINKYKLQSVSSSWGDIMGDIHNQKDLMNYIESLDVVSRDELTRLLAQEGVDIKEWVELQGYLKEHQPLKTVNGETLVGEGNIEIGGLSPEQEELVNQIPNKADKSEIPSLDGYATEEWVEGKGYLTEHQSLKTVNGETLVGEGNIEIGGLSPEQEMLINQVPRKVEQVRLITDGSVIRYEGAYEGLTFNQIYDLVMDNSKYVYIVMDNNIRFRPSAYDGDAIWFDSSFIEEGKANILRCIINSDNVVSIDQIVVAKKDDVKLNVVIEYDADTQDFNEEANVQKFLDIQKVGMGSFIPEKVDLLLRNKKFDYYPANGYIRTTAGYIEVKINFIYLKSNSNLENHYLNYRYDSRQQKFTVKNIIVIPIANESYVDDKLGQVEAITDNILS